MLLGPLKQTTPQPPGRQAASARRLRPPRSHHAGAPPRARPAATRLPAPRHTLRPPHHTPRPPLTPSPPHRPLTVLAQTNGKRIQDYPHLSNYVRDLYQGFGGAIGRSINMKHIKTHYFTSHPTLNAYAIVPVGLGDGGVWGSSAVIGLLLHCAGFPSKTLAPPSAGCAPGCPLVADLGARRARHAPPGGRPRVVGGAARPRAALPCGDSGGGQGRRWLVHSWGPAATDCMAGCCIAMRLDRQGQCAVDRQPLVL